MAFGLAGLTGWSEDVVGGDRLIAAQSQSFLFSYIDECISVITVAK